MCFRRPLARGPLVVYCHHGVRSRAVAEWLAERGLTGILNLQGGIDAWSREVGFHGAEVLRRIERVPSLTLVLEIGLAALVPTNVEHELSIGRPEARA